MSGFSPGANRRAAQLIRLSPRIDWIAQEFQPRLFNEPSSLWLILATARILLGLHAERPPIGRSAVQFGSLPVLRITPQRGFTLVETLVVIGIVVALVGILAPAIAGAVATSRGFRCQISMRSVAFDFQMFADEALHGDRGDDRGRTDFRLETFQESQYGVDEFWRWGDDIRVELSERSQSDTMRCPSVREPLTLRRNLACSNGAIGPPQSVSYGFNIRLDRAEIIDSRGRPRAVAVRLRPGILQQGQVPLLFDVDGNRAFENGVSPLYAGPSLNSQGPFAGDRFWFPAPRHGGKLNAVFLDGHVDSTSNPLGEGGWRWDYQPVP